MKVSIWISVVLGMFLGSTHQADVIVDTAYGPVQGHTVSLGNDEEEDGYINSFLAVPFAKPPVGQLRFQAPQEPDPWELFVADELGSACIQPIVGFLAGSHPGWLNFAEACLNLNVYAPQDMEGGPYPVMVFLHGGAYQGSANIQYPGHFLASRDVVLVVPNYRLGIFGFVSTGDEAAPGNFGMLDQLQALKFVNENIANFGGDPDKVTIFGQSAGAGSVGLMMMSPMAQGYFHQGILQSGSEMAYWAVNGDEVDPQDWVHEVAEPLGCGSDNNHEFCLGFAPVVDGEGGFLPDTPLAIRQSENFAQVPIMEGITREDGFLFAAILGLGNFTDFDGVSREDFEIYVKAALDIFGYLIEDDKTMEEIYQAVLFYYSSWPHLEDEPANLHELGMILTDVLFGYPTNDQIKLHTPYADSYYYVFGYRGENTVDLIPDWMGVPHIMDLPYVFGYPMLQHSPAVRNDSQMYNDSVDWTNEDRQYADLTMDLWTNFAKFGNPTPEPVGTPKQDDVTWEQWTEEEYKYLYIANDGVEMRENYRQRDYSFWTSYIRQMAFPDLPVTKSKGRLGHNLWQQANRAYGEMIAHQVYEKIARSEH